MINFYSGQKVVCIDSNPFSMMDRWISYSYRPPLNGGLSGLAEGKVYTIQWVGLWGDDLFTESICVHLYEFPNRAVPFDARRFRPVLEKKTNIEIFERLLNKTPEEIDA